VNSSQITLLVVVIVVVAALAYAAYRMFGPRQNLQGRFGDEYDRVVAAKGGRAAGESELRRRMKEHESYQLREVTDDDRARYRDSWMVVQREFVDDPSAAVRDAEQLVSVFITDRGYPATGYDDRLVQLSVEHASVLDHYRSAHEIGVGNDAGRATTEELRQALVHYRDLFTNLLGADLGGETTPTSSPLRNVTADAETTATDTTAADTTAAEAAGGDASLREVTVPERRLPAED
jgi:hypothetical protein